MTMWTSSMIPFRKMRTWGVLIWLFVSLRVGVYGQGADQDKTRELQEFVTQIYHEVSGEDQRSVNWEKVRGFFHEDAVIVLRTSFDGTTQLSVDQFIQDFKEFYQSPRVGEAGFKEEVIGMESRIYHEMAYVGIVYSATILNSEQGSQRGIDFWLLTLTEEGWKVIAVTNEVLPADEELPGWINTQVK